MIEAGWCRTLINRRVGRVVHMFKWGVAEELVPESVHNALARVDDDTARLSTVAGRSDQRVPEGRAQ